MTGAHAALPTVSVLTPSYNQARWLRDNLASVAAQTYPGIEHVVMDGGSTDGSVDLLRTWPGRLHWQSGPDAGQSDAINKAFHASSGEIVGWLNSDDAYFSSNAVAHAVRVFRDHPDVGVVFGHAALVNAEGTLLHVLWAPPFAQRLLRAYNLICQPTVFVRRSALGRRDLVDPVCDYMMDWEVWLHLARRTKFARLDEIVAIDRHQQQRKSYTRLDLAAHDYEYLTRRYRFPGFALNPLLQRGVKVGARVAGLTRLREAAGGGDAIELQPSPAREIALRQVAQFRRWMPSGER